MKLLNGLELTAFIKERQTRDVARLGSEQPKLAIIQCKDDPVINTYVRLKKRYGADIGVEVDTYFETQANLPALIGRLNQDKSVNGIIIQLPLVDPTQTDEIVNLVLGSKDVDGLSPAADFEPATPMAIMWLLAGYNINLAGQKILLIGRGKLVGAPLETILRKSNLDVEVLSREAQDLSQHTLIADVIITATGSPAIIYAAMLKPKAVVVDAGVASESGKTVGDLAEDVYKRDDLTVTPRKGGVGPLTVCALFENVITATRNQAENSV